MCTIIQEPNKVLRGIARDVSPDEITSKEVRAVLDCMQTALHREPDGVAIAAPQIGEPFRIFVVAGFVFDLKKKNKTSTLTPDKVFINPEIIKKSKEKQWIKGEGCLSVRWVYGTARRSKSATVRAIDETGKPFTMGASGLLAQIFQHECDHLEGILFVDHAKDIKHMTNAEIAEYQEELKRLQDKQ